jgi:hypothetical protein
MCSGRGKRPGIALRVKLTERSGQYLTRFFGTGTERQGHIG